MSKRHWKVTIVSDADKESGDSPLICPEIVMRYLDKLFPGAVDELKSLGSIHSTHQEMISAKFPQAIARNHGEFFFMGRKLFLRYLREKAKSTGVDFLEAKNIRLLVDRGIATGILIDELKLNANYVFDCTGSYRNRSTWLKEHARTGEIVKKSGSEEVMFLRFFESDKKPELKLRSGEKFRGGIYPVEGNRFAISMIVPARKIPRNLDKELLEFISFIGAEIDFTGSLPSGDWIRKDNISNYYSDFYLSGLTNEVKNFLAVGDSLIYSNPIYGRGIALTVYQLEAMMKNENLTEGLKAGFLDAFIKWKEVAEEKKSMPFRLLRKYYLYLLEKEPFVYEAFLDFYQLRITPWQLLRAVLTSPQSLKFIGLFVLVVSGLILVLSFYPR